MSHTRKELIKYRVDRAKEAFEDAKILLAQDRWNSAANRMYYACFYAISAYLALKELKATTHSGIKSVFNRELVKTGKISKEEGVLFNKLFAMRQDADYEDFAEVNESDLTPLVTGIEEFLTEIEGLIKKEDET